MFIPDPDPTFFHPGSRIRIFSIPDPNPWFFTHPGSRGQKGTGSRIWIRNTGCYACLKIIGYTYHKEENRENEMGREMREQRMERRDAKDQKEQKNRENSWRAGSAPPPLVFYQVRAALLLVD
jgi:hypothetical protein